MNTLFLTPLLVPLLFLSNQSSVNYDREESLAKIQSDKQKVTLLTGFYSLVNFLSHYCLEQSSMPPCNQFLTGS